MNIAVGCPVSNRAWILPSWFEYVDRAFAEIDLDPYYVLVVGTSADETEAVVETHMKSRYGEVFLESEVETSGVQRDWSLERYAQMVQIRNTLLGEVRKLQPDLFLSLDSDILIAPGVLSDLLEHIPPFDAVGGKLFMVPPPETFAPSYAFMSANSLQRSDHEGILKNVDVIMALKLMTPAAYSVDYQFHGQGEDIGWSLACKEAGLHFCWDGRKISKHVMKPEWLTKVDLRVGY